MLGRTGALAFTAVGALAVACATVQMKVPKDVAAESHVLEVRGRSSATGIFVDEGFKLGVYDVTNVDRKGDTTTSVDFVLFSEEETTSGYSYSIAQGRAMLKGKCRAKKGGKDVPLSKKFSLSFDYSKLACSCKHGGKMVQVAVDNSGSELLGKLVVGPSSYQVTTITDVEGGGSLPGPAGYRVDGDKPVGAVDVLQPGRAWVGKTLPEEERLELACLFAGLMLYVPPSEPTETPK